MSDSQPNNQKKSIKKLLAENSYQLVSDIISPLRVILASFIVFAVFLLAEQLLYLLFEWQNKDITSRIVFVSWVLDGVQVLSIVAVSI